MSDFLADFDALAGLLPEDSRAVLLQVVTAHVKPEQLIGQVTLSSGYRIEEPPCG